MKLKNGEILELYETLSRLSQNKELKLKVSLGYKLLKNKEQLYPSAKIVYELRQKILNDYGTRDKDGNIIVLKENIETVNNQINELMNFENFIDIVEISLDELEPYELNMEDIEGIRYIIK